MSKENETVSMGDLTSTTMHKPSQVRKIRITIVETTVNSLKNTTIELDPSLFNSITIGRSPENVIVFPDITVSRKHAEIVKDQGGGLRLIDVGSKNGTYIYVEGRGFEKVDNVALTNGMLVRFGMYTIVKVELIQ